MGGGVGEVHGAKLVGLLQRALRDRPEAVLLLAESGGVRLHEANAGLIAVSEVMRALLDVRAAGIPVIVLIGGANGCFGGMGIVARCADHIVMSDVGRLAMSGPEVIEASHGVEEFDSRDRALVWRTTGGKHRWLTGDCDALVEDDVAAFRAAAIAALGASRPVTLAALEAEHALLDARLHALPPTTPGTTKPRCCGAHSASSMRSACRIWRWKPCAPCADQLRSTTCNGIHLSPSSSAPPTACARTATSCRAK